MSQNINLNKSQYLQDLSEQEQEIICGGYLFPNSNIFMQITNLLTTAKSQTSATEDDQTITSYQETIYHYTQITLVIASSKDDAESSFGNYF
ncbi:hypothetical protein ACN23B_25800 [Anabaena sp. FACHB-709]|nr:MULTISPECIES: hypothetical protein [Nostocaceae]HBW31387.1 hypothetical protein [Nostoc sp. UBA8866]MBD2172709.1 hypothetical protein [Anabaena cylindrica FACHB-318]MBD2264321.1 hypothetical protein [Anabaena sp. FACHB-709]MBD2276450.1 hypothetical protein [Nostoc sp. PCC 7120 = FACHB-418]MBD2284579.1 hypothetical protein [Anabaena cylindrica FACHB-170]